MQMNLGLLIQIVYVINTMKLLITLSLTAKYTRPVSTKHVVNSYVNICILQYRIKPTGNLYERHPEFIVDGIFLSH